MGQPGRRLPQPGRHQSITFKSLISFPWHGMARILPPAAQAARAKTAIATRLLGLGTAPLAAGGAATPRPWPALAPPEFQSSTLRTPRHVQGKARGPSPGRTRRGGHCWARRGPAGPAPRALLQLEQSGPRWAPGRAPRASQVRTHPAGRDTARPPPQGNWRHGRHGGSATACLA